MFELWSAEEVEGLESDGLLGGAVIQNYQLAVQLGRCMSQYGLQCQLGVEELVVVEVDDDAAIANVTLLMITANMSLLYIGLRSRRVH